MKLAQQRALMSKGAGAKREDEAAQLEALEKHLTEALREVQAARAKRKK